MGGERRSYFLASPHFPLRFKNVEFNYGAIPPSLTRTMLLQGVPLSFSAPYPAQQHPVV